ncbi:unnamed protein product [Clonostachys byssicola]|uniref:Uncharacterized protein n=1 Tax=Clonostachys byssicola TaxID=160290 RepID=A0A9N9ULA4_9HYPO|nr:unnamed protein product [Clonostachys byssicola]
MQFNRGEASKSLLGQGQQSEPVSSPSPDLMSKDREEVLKAYAEMSRRPDMQDVLNFIGEQEAIRQLANLDANGKELGLMHHGGLLMPQERHSLKWDPTEVIPENRSLFNPTAILGGSQQAWLEETMRVGIKTVRSNLRGHQGLT